MQNNRADFYLYSLGLTQFHRLLASGNYLLAGCT